MIFRSKNFGKQIKVYHYIPLLDARNINDQGIDAAGATISSADYFVSFPDLATSYAVEADANALVAAVNAIEAGVAVKSGAGPWVVTMSKGTLVAGTLAEVNAVTAVYTTATVEHHAGYDSIKGAQFFTRDDDLILENCPRIEERLTGHGRKCSMSTNNPGLRQLSMALKQGVSGPI